MSLFKTSLFGIALFFASNVFAATGTGEAQAELTNPLSISGRTVDFGIIAIDPAAGSQTISIDITSTVTCPSTYICAGSPQRGFVDVMGAPNAAVNASLTSTATLSDGLGHTLIFDPFFHNGTDFFSFIMPETGQTSAFLIGSITFTGNEPAGTYSSSNAGGSGYTMTLNY